MYDKALVIDILNDVLSSMEHVLRRFEVIRSSGDFVKDDGGREKLDSICMQLIAIGEALKTDRQADEWRVTDQVSEC